MGHLSLDPPRRDMSSWDTASGGGLFDEGTLTITKARFGYDAGYDDGDSLVLILEGTSPDFDDEVRQLYSIGNGWDAEDKGKKVVGLEEFNESTNYAVFFTTAISKKVGGGELLSKRGYPDDATIWEDTIWEMKRQDVERDWGGDDGKRISKVVLPTKYIGLVGDKKKAGESGNSGGGKKAKSLKSKLKKLARKFDDHDEFLVKALDKYPELEEDEALMESVMSEKGLWKKARK